MPLTPTESEAQAQLVAQAAIREFLRDNAESAATNLLGLADTSIQLIEGDYHDELDAGISRVLGVYDTLIGADAIDDLLTPALKHWGKVAAATDDEFANVTLLLERIGERMVDTSGDRVASRQFTYGSASSSGSGDGDLLRLTVDADGFDLENTTPETKEYRCIRDASSGAFKHEEVFEIRGEDAGRTNLELLGSGLKGTLRARSARDSLLRNPSFSSYSGTTSTPTALTGYTVNTIANLEIDTTNYYRDYRGDTTPASAKISGDIIISQQVSAARVQRLNRRGAYYLGIAYNRQIGSGSMTLRIRLGSQTATVALSAQTGWNVLALPLDANSYFENFNEQDLDITVEVESYSSGYVLIDDFLFVEMDTVDNIPTLIRGGATPFLYNDTFTVVDADVVTLGVIQRQLWFAYDEKLPPAADAPSSAPSGALAGAGAGNVDNGTHSYKVTFVPQNANQESGGSAASGVVTVSDQGTDGQVTVSSIPTGPTGTVARKVYRTVAGDTGDYKLVGTIADNSTTTFNDNVADGSLGATIPDGVTIADPA